MLSEFSIQNFGLIDNLTVNFTKGLNVFTGETGAGKSILIDALRYLLGERFNSIYVRDAKKPCVLQGVFDLDPRLYRMLADKFDYIESDDQSLIVSKSFSPDGKTRNRINNMNVTNAQLKDIGDLLVDFHGPHDHQLLLSSRFHIEILDKLTDFGNIQTAFSAEFLVHAQIAKRLSELESLTHNREKEMAVLDLEIKELEQVKLDPEKYEQTAGDFRRIGNVEKLFESACAIRSIFDDSDTGVTNILSRVFPHLKALNNFDPGTRTLTDLARSAQDDLETLISNLARYIDGLSFNPDKAAKITREYEIYAKILKIYGPTIQDAKDHYAEIKIKKDTLSNVEENSSLLRNELSDSTGKLQKMACEISSKRKKTAKSLKDTIERELKDLGMPNVRFDCRIETAEMNDQGHDNVTFYISPNLGEQMKPLADIVSSGECARIMLALKKALIKADPVPVLIFDEIDAQIGGRLGTVTGTKLKQLSQDRQVVLITHLPQIASFADTHIKVIKTEQHERTCTGVKPLKNEERVLELAKMMSGEMQTDIAVEHAREMILKAKK